MYDTGHGINTYIVRGNRCNSSDIFFVLITKLENINSFPPIYTSRHLQLFNINFFPSIFQILLSQRQEQDKRRGFKPFLAFMSMLRYIFFFHKSFRVMWQVGLVLSLFFLRYSDLSLHERHCRPVSPTSIHATWPLFSLFCNLYLPVLVLSTENTKNLARVALESCPP